MIANRMAYGQTVCDLAHSDDKIVIVDADLQNVVNYGPFLNQFPDRYFECGIAEQDMVGIAAGLASCGLTAFTASFAVFSSMRALDQIRNMVCYNNLNVKVIGTHAGVETGQDGGTHQAIEDIAIMRALPNMKVLAPSTPRMTTALTRQMCEIPGPFYMRFGREPNLELYSETESFPVGKSKLLKQGEDLTIIACGRMVEYALDAANILEGKGIKARVIDMYSIKPLDEAAVVDAAKQTGRLLTVEDHSVLGGLGGAVAEVVATQAPCLMSFCGIPDVFGRSGTWNDLLNFYRLTPEGIVDKALELLEK